MFWFLFILFMVGVDSFMIPTIHHRLDTRVYSINNHNLYEFHDLLVGCGHNMTQLNQCNGNNKVVYISNESNDRCKRIQKRIERLAEDFPTISFYHLPVHTDDYELFMNLRVPAIPYFILYRGGERLFAHKSFDSMLIHKIITLLTDFLN